MEHATHNMAPRYLLLCVPRYSASFFSNSAAVLSASAYSRASTVSGIQVLIRQFQCPTLTSA